MRYVHAMCEMYTLTVSSTKHTSFQGSPRNDTGSTLVLCFDSFSSLELLVMNWGQNS